MTLQEMILALVRHWKLIVLGAVLTGGAALGFSLMQTPTYEAEATVAMSQNRVSVNLGSQKDQQQLKSMSKEQAALMLRRSQDLESRRKALVNLVTSSAVAKDVYQQLSDRLPEGMEGPSDLLGIVEGSNDGDAILISVTHPDPQLASSVANAWGEAYEAHINSIFGRTSLKPEVVRKETKRAKAEYQSAQQELEQFLAENRINEIKRKIEEKKAILSSLTKAKKRSVEAVVNAEIEARSEIVSTYVKTQLQNLIKPFQKEQQDRLQKLSDDYATRRRLKDLVASANSLRKQLQTSNAAAVGATSSLPILLMKIRATTGKIPGNLELSLSSSQLSGKRKDQIQSLSALIKSLRTRIQRLDKSIRQRSSQLLKNKGYEFINAEIAESLEGKIASKEENLLAQVANSVSKQVLQLQGLEEVPSYSTATKPLSQAVTKLENQIDQLESQIESEQARKKNLTRARDLAWEQFKTLSTKRAETDIASSITGTEVRFASPALPPSSPTGPSTRLNTLLGGFVGLILMMGLALVVEHPAVRELRSGAASDDEDPDSPQTE
ncbi:MAG: GumC family protein [Salinibacter sp.]